MEEELEVGSRDVKEERAVSSNGFFVISLAKTGLVKVINTLDNEKILKVAGVFIYIGYRPATDFIDKKLLDAEGYIKVNDKFETTIKNVYAIGDIIKKDVYQLVTAASDGARVINYMK